MVDEIFDTKSLQRCKGKATKKWSNHNFIFKKFSPVLLEKIKVLGLDLDKILLITSDKNEMFDCLNSLKFQELIIVSRYDELLKDVKLNRNARKYKLEYMELNKLNEKFDLIICNFNLHNINHKIEYVKILESLLSTNGLLVCNCFGENTLIELKQSLIKTDEKIFQGVHLRIPLSIKMNEVSELFTKSGYSEIVIEKVGFDIYYRNVMELLFDIKGIGEASTLKKKYKSLITPNYLSKLNEIYKEKYSNNNSLLKSTCEILSATMWKNQQSKR